MAPGCCPWSVDDLPPCSLTDLFFVFTPPSHALDVGPESSIISLTIPLIAQSPAIFHSMVSCSAIFLSQKQPSWRQVAIRHHCEALRNLALEMSDGRLSEPSVAVSSMAVILMIHLFESFDASSKTPSYAHLLAVHDIFFKVPPKNPPDTTLGALILEAYVYRVAINSPFHPELLKAYASLEALTTLLMSSPAMGGSEIASFRRSLWLGMPPDLYGLLYKASFLLHTTLLDGGQMKEALILSHHLEALQTKELLDDGPDERALLTETDALAAQAQHLYIAAAKLLVLKVLYRDIQATDDRVQSLLSEATVNTVSFNAIKQYHTPLLICPIAILGTAAIRAQDREILLAQLNRMRSLTGSRESDSVLCFLQDLWSSVIGPFEDDPAEPGLGSPQLDVWLDYPRLRCVSL
ncbi:uncharacterized protein A1O9_11819 [Exophiala aquamarina CBS 119918]|uniref:Transcription factor domain-containing protein n=1 Tax=Exophiala aquamarina CBS 119918 TaxID=1182545 RepID=A0A072NXN6_9EURO|nr:uncharacterized protein A1O9_11819 [Exophiala aquamarina CBS 119918]KEF52192.1 hypothetical protein A1O9_11819 [Exophiala aquamarina CBS 119918]